MAAPSRAALTVMTCTGTALSRGKPAFGGEGAHEFAVLELGNHARRQATGEIAASRRENRRCKVAALAPQTGFDKRC